MASVGFLIGGTLINALAFSGIINQASNFTTDYLIKQKIVPNNI